MGLGEGEALGEAVGVALGCPVAPAEAEGAAVFCAVAEGEALAEGLALGLGVSLLIGLESSTTPQTLQVLCSVPIFFSVAAAASSQSVATWPGAGIISV